MRREKRQQCAKFKAVMKDFGEMQLMEKAVKQDSTGNTTLRQKQCRFD